MIEFYGVILLSPKWQMDEKTLERLPVAFVASADTLKQQADTINSLEAANTR